MKVCIFTDNHFCENSSIIRRFGTKYTVRIENQLESLKWVEQTARNNNCDAVICLGDFFDKPNLTDMELTAVKDIEWTDIPHYFLVGNHESSVNGLTYNSTSILGNTDNPVISSPYVLAGDDGSTICFLPYVIESDRKPVSDYFGPKTGKRIILSHNDIKGIQMGPVESKTGFTIEDLEANADLVINGHLHNGQPITRKIINLGNLTGQNFGEDATRYNHNIMILDTATLKYELIENPHAFNFYKLEVNKPADLNVFNNLKNNAVITVKCNIKLAQEVKDIISKNDRIIESRIIITKDMIEDATEIDMSSFSVDHIEKFIECAHAHYGNDAILEAELAEVCK